MGSDFITWVTTHVIGLIVGLIVLVLVLRFARPIIHRFVLTILRAQQATLDGGGEPSTELRKRAATLEELLVKLIRIGVIALFIVLVLSVFDLWEMLAGLGLVAAALTIAGQQVILDYIMGILILVEGQYFKGDWLVVPASNGIVQGVVEEVGLRRTILRDIDGTAHSVSNGEIRVASNMTRVYAVATVEMAVLRSRDLTKAMATVNAVCDEMGDDPEWSKKILDSPRVITVSSLTLDGATIRVRFRVEPDSRWAAASELRQRLAVAFAAEEISLGKWDTIPQSAFEAGMAIAAQAPPTA